MMSTDDQAAEQPEQAEPYDVLLSSYVRYFNRQRDTSDMIGVTLFMGGTIVTGSLVGAHAYLAALADEMDNDGSPFGDMFRDFAAKATPPAGADPDDDTDETHPEYLHLRNAKVLLAGGNTIPSNRGVAFRGRLDAVDGWVHGVLAEGPPG